MPLHLCSTNRRRFLQGISAASVSLAVGSQLNADESPSQVDDQFFALLADTHIPATPDGVKRGINMTDHFKSVLDQIIQMSVQPANLIINGDCANTDGKPGEYQNFSDCLSVLDDKGIDLHLTMGNHDNRDVLYEHFVAGRPESHPIPTKHVGVIEGEFANWFLVDTLVRPGISRGEIGWDQLKWLMKELDARADKPAIVVAHHNPQLTKPEPGGHWMGIWDTDAFLAALTDRPHVRALMYGHTHAWRPSMFGNLHLINLPAVSYVFGNYTPSGWVSAHLTENAMTLKVYALDPTHPRHGDEVEIQWRLS